MESKTHDNTTLEWLLTAALGVAVFCYWGYIAPYLIVGRESLQLLICDADTLTTRLAEPGGLARYLGESLIQLFRYVSAGAVALAVLAVVVQRLSWRLIRETVGGWTGYLLSMVPSLLLTWADSDIDTPLTLHIAVLLVLALLALVPRRFDLVLLPVGYWLTGPAVGLLLVRHWRKPVMLAGLAVLLVASTVVSSRLVSYPLRRVALGIDYRMPEPGKMGTREEMAYDYLLRCKDWDAIIQRASRDEPQTLALQNVVRLAKWYRGQLSEEELKECLHHTNRVLTSTVAAEIMSDVYMHLRMLSMSQRASFEVMESLPDGNKSARAMQRQVETCLASGQYELALKYIGLLEQTLMYRGWAHEMRLLAEHPERISQHPVYGPLQEVWKQTVNVYFI